MNILIAYATKTGAAKTCAEILAKDFPNCIICNIGKNLPDIDSFDVIIIGSGVRMGKIYKPASRFIKNNLSTLLLKRSALFLCNADPDTIQKTIDKNIPETLKTAAISIESFGGKPPFTSNADDHTWIKKDNISSFVQAIKALKIKTEER